MSEKPVRICHLLAQRPGRTGSGVYLNSLVHQAAQRCWPQEIIAGVPASDQRDIIPLSLEASVNPVLFETPVLPFPVVGMSDVMPYPSTRYRDLTPSMVESWRNAFLERVGDTVSRFQPQIFLSHHLWLLSGTVKTAFPQIPMIALSHGTGLRQLQLSQNLAPDIVRLCGRIDHVVALTEQQRLEIETKYGIASERITVIGPGYNEEVFSRSETVPSLPPVHIVYAGKLSFSKGVLSLLKAFSRLDPRSFPVKLTLCGSGGTEEEAVIRSFASQMPHETDFKGAVSQTELASILRSAHLFVLPSFYEGVPLVVVEALACGCEVIVTDLPGLREWLGSEMVSDSKVSLVDLPAMEGIDTPVADEVPAFEERLSQAIAHRVAARTIQGSSHEESLDHFLKDKSWLTVFNRIEKIIKKLVYYR